MSYTFNANGEITNATPEIDTGDFRAYEPYTVEHNGIEYKIRTCADLVGGRWEYFTNYASRKDAQLARKARVTVPE